MVASEGVENQLLTCGSARDRVSVMGLFPVCSPVLNFVIIPSPSCLPPTGVTRALDLTARLATRHGVVYRVGLWQTIARTDTSSVWSTPPLLLIKLAVRIRRTGLQPSRRRSILATALSSRERPGHGADRRAPPLGTMRRGNLAGVWREESGTGYARHWGLPEPDFTLKVSSG